MAELPRLCWDSLAWEWWKLGDGGGSVWIAHANTHVVIENQRRRSKGIVIASIFFSLMLVSLQL